MKPINQKSTTIKRRKVGMSATPAGRDHPPKDSAKLVSTARCWRQDGTLATREKK